MILIYTFIVLCFFIYFRLNLNENFITNQNKSRLYEMSMVYKNFLKKYPDEIIIQTLKNENGKYNIFTYNKFNNISSIYQLFNNNIIKIKSPFLLNELDNDLNVLENSKQLVSFKEYKNMTY